MHAPATATRAATVRWLASAAGFFAAAGLIHAAAAGSHAAESPELAWLFAATAGAQVGWAALAYHRPSTRVASIGVALGVACVGFWVVTRLAGVPVNGLRESQPVTFQDLGAAVLAGLGLLAALGSLRARLDRQVLRALPMATGLAALAFVVPAMTVEHNHNHDHAEVVAADGSTHPHDASTIATDGRLAGFDLSGITPEQQAAAERLIADTAAGVSGYADTATATAAGFISIGDSITGFEHFVNYDNLLSAGVLEPGAPESLVYSVAPDGTRTLVSAMYILPPGQRMADVPDIAGSVTAWHEHLDLCWRGVRVVARSPDATQAGCPPGSTLQITPPMLHVWVAPNECGPFAGLEGHETGTCNEHSH